MIRFRIHIFHVNRKKATKIIKSSIFPTIAFVEPFYFKNLKQMSANLIMKKKIIPFDDLD